MKHNVIKGNDIVISLNMKDNNGNSLKLTSTEVFKSLSIKAYVDSTDTPINITQFNDNMLKIQSTDLDKLKRGFLILDITAAFNSDLFSDNEYNYHKIIRTNIYLS